SVGPTPLAYAGTAPRAGAPSDSNTDTGTSAARPARSHSAMSIALIACHTGPGAPHWRPIGSSAVVRFSKTARGSLASAPITRGATPSDSVAIPSAGAQDR